MKKRTKAERYAADAAHNERVNNRRWDADLRKWKKDQERKHKARPKKTKKRSLIARLLGW